MYLIILLYIFYVAEVLWNISLRCVTFAYVVEYLFNDAKKISLAAVWELFNKGLYWSSCKPCEAALCISYSVQNFIACNVL